jgi:glycosyltransferase involved in cell wall biosynthesis
LTDDVSRALAYAAVDLLIQPSTGESFGNVILEALSCGTPVVSYATGIAPELLTDGRGGALIGAGEEDALIAAVIDRLDATAPDRQAVRSLTVGYDIADMTAAYTDLYRRLISVAGAAL